MFESYLSQWFQLWLEHFSSPNKRLYWGYLFTTVLLAYWCFRHQKFTSEPSFIKYAIPKDVWLHSSSRLDLQVWALNILLKFTVIGSLLFSANEFGIWLFKSLSSISDLSLDQEGNLVFPLSLFTLFVFFVDDFSRYFLHMLLHKVPLLWRLHKLHHSAEVLTPITVYRIHPIESLLYGCRLTLVHGITLGLGVFLFSSKLEIYEVAGANAAVFIFNLFGANLRHSHLWLSWGDAFEKWFISPAQHQIHHSTDVKHFDKNFGSCFAIWDRMFGSLVLASSVKKKLNFGLDDFKPNSVFSAYFNAFKIGK